MGRVDVAVAALEITRELVNLANNGVLSHNHVSRPIKTRTPTRTRQRYLNPETCDILMQMMPFADNCMSRLGLHVAPTLTMECKHYTAFDSNARIHSG